MEKKFIEKAIIHTIGEKIGFEEAEVYWAMLHKSPLGDINKSKKYRILQNLFKSGLLLKIRMTGVLEYIPVPPTFLYFEKSLEEKLIKQEEEKYIQLYGSLFKDSTLLLETNGEIIDGLILFLIKNFMKKEALMLIGGSPIYGLLKTKIPDKFEKIKFLAIKDFFNGVQTTSNLTLKPRYLISDRRFCIIDNSFLIVFSKSLENLFTGYLTNNPELIKTKTEEFNFLRGF